MIKLGLDLGIGSIGYAVVDIDREEILEANNIIIPTKDSKSGKATVSACFQRRIARAQRRIIQRKQLRNVRLDRLFKLIGINKNADIDKSIMEDFATYMGDHKFKNSQNHAVWFLRHFALTKQLSLDNLARVIYNVAQHRGFSFDDNIIQANKTTDEVNKYNTKKRIISDTINKNYTISQYMMDCIKNDEKHTDLIIHESHYKEELYNILKKQSEFYPFLSEKNSKELIKICDVLYKNNIEHKNRRKKGNLIDFIIDDVIFYTRPLKSKKSSRGKCNYMYSIQKQNGKDVKVYKTVCNSTNYYFQSYKLWKYIHDNFKDVDTETKHKIYDYLNYTCIVENKNNYTITELCKELNINKKDKRQIIINELNKKLYDIIKDCPDFKTQLRNIITNEHYINDIINIIRNGNFNKDNIINKFKSYGINDDVAGKILSNFKIGIDYTKYSESFIKKVLPYINGTKSYMNEYDAINMAIEDGKIPVRNEISDNDVYNLIPNNSYINQNVRNVVNNTIKLLKRLNEQYDISQVILETNRDLRNSKKIRNQLTNKNDKLRKENQEIISELNNRKVSINDKNIIKYKLFKEQGGICIYTGNEINDSKLYSSDYQLDHIIPRSTTGENYCNTDICVLVESMANKDKSNDNVIDYIKKEQNIDEYKNRVNKLYKNNKNKKDRLLCKSNDDFELNRKTAHSNNTSHINKLVRERVEKIVGKGKVLSPNGYITNIISSNTGIKSFYRTKLEERYKQLIAKQLKLESIPDEHLIDLKTHYCNGNNDTVLDNLSWFKKTENGNIRIDNNFYDKHIDYRNHTIDALLLIFVTHSLIKEINSNNKYDNKKTDKELSDLIAKSEPFENYSQSIIDYFLNNKIKTIYKNDTKKVTIKNNYITKIVNGKKVKVLGNKTITPKMSFVKEQACRIRLSNEYIRESIKKLGNIIESYIPFYFNDDSTHSLEQKIDYIKNRHKYQGNGKNGKMLSLLIGKKQWNPDGYIKLRNDWYQNDSVVAIIITKNGNNYHKQSIKLYDYLQNKDILTKYNENTIIVRNGDKINIDNVDYIVCVISSSNRIFVKKLQEIINNSGIKEVYRIELNDKNGMLQKLFENEQNCNIN